MGNPKYEDYKLDALAKLNQGKSPKEVSQELNIPYATILKWRREFNEAQEEDKLRTVINVDSQVINKISQTVKQDLAKVDPELGELVDETLEKLEGAKMLDLKVQNTALELTNKINEAINRPNLAVGEIRVLTESLATIQNSFFNKATVNNLNLIGQDTNGKSMVESLFTNKT